MIFTEALSGRTVIELWRGGRRVDGEEQVVQEGASTSPATPTSLASSTTPPSQLLFASAGGEARAPAPSLAQSAVPKSSLQLTRKGERTRNFFFGALASPRSRGGGNEEGAAEAEAAREMSRRLRTETERERRSMLLHIFEAAHARARRRRRGSGRGGGGPESAHAL